MRMRLIHPVVLRVAPLDRATHPRDGVARRAQIRPVYLDAVEIEAQLDWARHDDRGSDGLSGADITHVADATVRMEDLRRLGWTPQRGDRVLSIVDCDGCPDMAQVYVATATPTAMWAGGASAVVIRLEDRHPGRMATTATSY